LVVAYFTTVDQVMGFDYRYLYPLVPVFSIVGGVGVTALVADGRLRFGRKRVLRNAALLAVMAAIAWSLARQGTRASDVEAYRAYGAGLRRANLLLGDALGAVAWQTPDPVLALTDAGAVPYLSRLTTIDLFSLNEPYLVTHPNADRAAYLRAMHPTVVVLVSRRPDAFVAVFPYERGVHDALLEQGFTSRATFKFDDTYYLWVLWRPDGPDAPALESILSAASRRSHAMAGLRLVPARSQTEEASGRVSSHAVNDGRAWSMR
jgi:hypothetical protein